MNRRQLMRGLALLPAAALLPKGEETVTRPAQNVRAIDPNVRPYSIPQFINECEWSDEEVLLNRALPPLERFENYKRIRAEKQWQLHRAAAEAPYLGLDSVVPWRVQTATYRP